MKEEENKSPEEVEEAMESITPYTGTDDKLDFIEFVTLWNEEDNKMKRSYKSKDKITKKFSQITKSAKKAAIAHKIKKIVKTVKKNAILAKTRKVKATRRNKRIARK